MKRRNYLDFDLQLTRQPDGYVVRVLESPAGQATARATDALFQPPLAGAEDGWPELHGPEQTQRARVVGQELFRHKTRKRAFRLVLLGVFLLQAGAIYGYWRLSRG